MTTVISLEKAVLLPLRCFGFFSLRRKLAIFKKGSSREVEVGGGLRLSDSVDGPCASDSIIISLHSPLVIVKKRTPSLKWASSRVACDDSSAVPKMIDPCGFSCVSDRVSLSTHPSFKS
eukprot:scaffold24438_cov122-Cylindrotheca_fusiformis.AAC.1